MKLSLPKPKYYCLMDFLQQLDESYKSGCLRLYRDHKDIIKSATGATSGKHQNWIGGYVHHLEEVMNYARLHFIVEQSTGRPIDFTFSDVVLVLYLHDMKKPFEQGPQKYRDQFAQYADEHAFIFALAEKYSISLTSEHKDALINIHGEGDKYHPTKRIMEPLAAFVHMEDTWSARGRHDYPRKDHDPWKHG